MQPFLSQFIIPSQCINQEKNFSTSFSLEINFKSIKIKSIEIETNCISLLFKSENIYNSE